MPTPSNLALRLNRFVEKALGENSALDFNGHVVTDLGSQKKRISWSEQQPFNPLAHLPGTLGEYLYYLRDRHFSLVNLDGSLLQLSFEIHHGRVVSHRLNFVPCPIDLDLGLLALDTLDNVVEQLFLSSPRTEVRLRSSLRFDYDPDAAGQNHPASHLTLNFDSTRIPVSRNFDVSMFLKFVLDNFFSGRGIKFGSTYVVGGDPCNEVMDPAHRLVPHLAWQTGL